jgi:Ser/Thr protein kinase RdoA (MazF antagonist)
MAGKSLSAAARHGDFTPRNILISGKHIGVIDFENFLERDTIYEDVGKFVAFLGLLKGRPGYSHAAINSVIQSFLEGYDLSGDRKLVDLFALKAAVRIFSHRGMGRVVKSLGLDNLYVQQFIRLGHELGQSLDLSA